MDRLWLQQQVAKCVLRALKSAVGAEPAAIKHIVDVESEQIVDLLEQRVVIAKTSGEVISS